MEQNKVFFFYLSDTFLNKSLQLCSSPGKAQKSHLDETSQLFKFEQGPMYKPFYEHNLQTLIISKGIFHVRTFQPSLIFVGKAGAHQGESPLRMAGSRPYRQTLDSAWKSCQVKKHSSLLWTFVSYGRKKFDNIGPRSGINLIRTNMCPH